MEFIFLGGAMEIGASCIYVKAAGKRLLLDSGIRQSAAKDPLPDFRTIQEQGGVDAIIVSHAHMDHIGTLPIISKAYPEARIYMTVMTEELTRVLLYDSLKIMAYREDEIPHYTEQDVLNMLGRITPVRYQTELFILDTIKLTLYPAGHIAGAACVYLATEEGTLFYSGDFAAFSQRTIEGIHIPKLRPDAAIVETTYGSRLHANRQVEEKRLVDLVRECVEKGQKILIPAFALGRSQEVLLILRAAVQNGEMPAVPVYVDGMVRDINIVYTRNPTFLKNALGKRILRGGEPFYTKEIQPVAPLQSREELLERKGAAVIISSSGMLTGGPSVQYAKKLVQSENACIIITGYQDEESPGRQLLSLLEEQEERQITLDGATLPVKCRIEQVGLSAHGDKSEITALLERLSARHVFLVHGNEETIRDYG
ncbi:MAG: MBL fold metallo-hydrolase, partial [Lachnospiraceae bacterium]|nr:MBL fold metallo-hydrolase [Lachnospiraceae bacterium]